MPTSVAGEESPRDWARILQGIESAIGEALAEAGRRTQELAEAGEERPSAPLPVAAGGPGVDSSACGEIMGRAREAAAAADAGLRSAAGAIEEWLAGVERHREKLAALAPPGVK